MFSLIQKKTQALLLVAAFLCLLMAAAYGGAIYLLRQKGEAVSALPEQITTLSRQADEYQNAKHVLLETAAARAHLQTFLFKDDDAARFFGDVERAAKGVNAAVAFVSADAAGGQGLRVEAEISGSWESAMRFLALLEAYPAPIEVTNISLRVPRSPDGGKGKQAPTWTGSAVFTLKSYIGS